MSRTKGSRNQKYTVVEQLEQEKIDPDQLAAAEETVEARFSEDVRPLPDENDLQAYLNTYQVRRQPAEPPRPPRRDKSQLPTFLENIPDGEEKDKAIRAAAQAAFLLGQSPSQIALQYGIPQSTISQWQDTLLTAGAIGRRDRLSDMLLVYIEQELKSLMAISIVTSEERWLRRQSAGELAHYIAVKSDRLMAMLAAFGKAEETRKRYVQQLEVIEQHA